MALREIKGSNSPIPLPVEQQAAKEAPILTPTDQKVSAVVEKKIVLTEKQKAEAAEVGAEVVSLSSTTALFLVNLIIGIAALYLYNAFRDK